VLRFCRCHARASRDVMAGNRAAVCVGGIITRCNNERYSSMAMAVVEEE
jgi:hypothetical protein